MIFMRGVKQCTLYNESIEIENLLYQVIRCYHVSDTCLIQMPIRVSKCMTTCTNKCIDEDIINNKN